MSNENKGAQLPTSRADTSADLASTYRPEPKRGPSENVAAVWAILQQNWPNAFKSVDLQDPAKVWADNLDDLPSRAMVDGLKAIRRLDERYMPNAPGCRKIILESTVQRVSEEQNPPQIWGRPSPKEYYWQLTQAAYADRLAGGADLAKSPFGVPIRVDRMGRDQRADDFDFTYLAVAAQQPSGNSPSAHQEAFKALQRSFEAEWQQP